MKSEIPGTLSSAARQILKALGIKKVEEIVRRSAAMIYKWSDPSLRYYPNLNQALELDVLFVRDGLGPPPFLTAYTSLLKRGVKSAERPAQGEVITEALKLVNVACDILVEVSAQVPGSATEGKSRASKTCSICKNLRELAELESAVTWRLENDPAEKVCPLRKNLISASDCSISRTVG